MAKAPTKTATATPAEKPAKAAKPTKVEVAKVEQNGIIRPSADTTTGKVWEIADRLSKAKKAPAARADVLAETSALGINDSTAATQYGKWCKFNGVTKETKAAAKPAKAAPAPKAAKTKAAKAAE
jgi:hypothetical protein